VVNQKSKGKKQKCGFERTPLFRFAKQSVGAGEAQGWQNDKESNFFLQVAQDEQK